MESQSSRQGCQSMKEICRVDGCSNIAPSKWTKGFCKRHYYVAYPDKRPICSVEGCGRTRHARGLCTTHIARMRNGQDLAPPVQRRGKPGAPIGHRYITKDGYAKVKIGGGHYIFEHRHVYENLLGRKLHQTEKVHHRNGDRQDNRIQNLELCSTLQPPGQRVSDKLAYAREILAMYSDVEANL